MKVGNTLYTDSLVGFCEAPGYRDIGIQLDLDRGDGKKERVEVQLDAKDSLTLLRQLHSAHRLAWYYDRPIDGVEGEARQPFTYHVQHFLYLDEIEAIQREAKFVDHLNDRQSPFRSETVSVNGGEGGATTAHYQNGKLVGLTSRFRDDGNRTILVCVDLR